jgi:hypothetical protein
MRIRRAFALLLVVAAGCGGNADGGSARGDYLTQLQRVSETAHIQERGVRRDLRIRLEEPQPGEDPMSVLTVFLDQSARLYQDVVDALGQLEPPDPELAAAQRAYREAWRSQLDLIVAVRDAGLRGPDAIIDALGKPALRRASAETKARCEDLQAAVEASGSNVDLVCDGRVS